MDRIHLAQTKNKGWAVVYKVINSHFLKKKQVINLVDKELLASEE